MLTSRKRNGRRNGTKNGPGATLVQPGPDGRTLTCLKSKSASSRILDRLSTPAERVRVQGRSGWVTKDPDDDKFIDAALSGGATIIVSGDRHLLALGTVEGIEILTARQFLDRLAAVRPEVPPDPA